MFKGHSFADLVDVQNGEKLGGVAVRPVSWQNFLATQLFRRMGIDDSVDKPEIVLGVLDNSNKPCAIIHFGEGATPRRPESVFVNPAKNSPVSVGDTIVEL